MSEVDDRELAGLCGRAWEAANSEDLDATIRACEEITDWWDARHIRWMERLEQERAQRRLEVLVEIDELDREITQRINGHKS